MRGKLLIVFVFALALLPVVNAMQTEIVVYTKPYHDITITILGPSDQYELIKSYPDIYSTNKGVVTVTYEGLESSIKVNVVGKDNGATAFHERFGPLDTGGVIELELPEGSKDKPSKEDEEEELEESEEGELEAEEGTDEEEGEEGLEEVEVVEEVDTQESGEVTGNVISGSGFGGITNIIYYIVGILIVAGIIGFVAGKMIRSRKEKMGMAIPKSEKIKFKKEGESGGISDKELQDAERKLREAQAEISRIKNKDKIKEAEEKLRKDREALERLRRGDD